MEKAGVNKILFYKGDYNWILDIVFNIMLIYLWIIVIIKIIIVITKIITNIFIDTLYL